MIGNVHSLGPFVLSPLLGIVPRLQLTATKNDERDGAEAIGRRQYPEDFAPLSVRLTLVGYGADHVAAQVSAQRAERVHHAENGA